MIKLKLSIEQALAVYALIGFVNEYKGSEIVDLVECKLDKKIPKPLRESIWKQTALYCEGIDVSKWDKIIQKVMQEEGDV